MSWLTSRERKTESEQEREREAFRQRLRVVLRLDSGASASAMTPCEGFPGREAEDQRGVEGTGPGMIVASSKVRSAKAERRRG